MCGLDSDSLFTGSPRDAAHAVFTATATGALVARSVEGVVHALDIDGELTVFTGGRKVARYHLDLQDVLTVIAPNTGLPVLNGEAQQTEAGEPGRRSAASAGSAKARASSPRASALAATAAAPT